jgi:hypothetical protein
MRLFDLTPSTVKLVTARVMVDCGCSIDAWDD